MKKFIINGVEFCDFGKNNYSDGMHCVTAYPVKSEFYQEVLDGKYPGIFLNPSADCLGSIEFFGVWGTPEQYKEFYKHQRDSCIAKAVIEACGGPESMIKMDSKEFTIIKDACTARYHDWWH